MSDSAAAGREGRFVGEADDFVLGPPPPSPGFTVDVDGDGETVATVKDGAWTSANPSLAGYLNARAAEIGDVSDEAYARDALDIMDLPDDALTRGTGRSAA